MIDANTGAASLERTVGEQRAAEERRLHQHTWHESLAERGQALFPGDLAGAVQDARVPLRAALHLQPRLDDVKGRHCAGSEGTRHCACCEQGWNAGVAAEGPLRV